jgi:hypothetical protein
MTWPQILVIQASHLDQATIKGKEIYLQLSMEVAKD